MVFATTCLIALALPITWAHADADITPPEPLPLGGYTARADKVMAGVGDRLLARACLLRQGTLRVSIVACDMLTIPESLRREVATRLPKDMHLLLVATHTHCAPDSQMLNDQMTMKVPGIASYKSRWLDWYADAIARAVKAAMAAPQARVGRFQWKQWEAAGCNAGRRQDAKPDPMATLLEADGRPVLFEFAAHGTFYGDDENVTRGDWPAAVAATFKCLAVPGAIGDVSPRSPGGTPAERIESFAATMRKGRDLSRQNSVMQNPELRYLEVPVQLDPVVPSAAFAKEFKVPEALSKLLVDKFAPRSAFLTVVAIGDFVVVGVPGEPSAELGRRIAASFQAAGMAQTIVLSHSNGWIGYILEPSDFDKGGYEAALGFYGRQTADRVVEAASKAAGQIRLANLASTASAS